MKRFYCLIINFFVFSFFLNAQNIEDDFEGSGTITTWFGDNCTLDENFTNPYQSGINTSTTVLKYSDSGGQYANARFDVASNFDLSTDYTFTLKIYVPSSGITGSQTNQISLKLQDGTIGSPWMTQSEIIKPITLDQWQTLTFDFLNDSSVNFDPSSDPPTQRTDFNRVILQVNGENNFDHVIAYIDDVLYEVTPEPDFDVLVWSDEFNTSGAVTASKWHHQTQLPSGGSWYNGEIQHYTDEVTNSFMSNGNLNIVAIKESYTDQGQTKQYTSARLNSKYAFKYGKVEIRAKLPLGAGTWPALWMLGRNINEDGAYWDEQGYGDTGWPACGEIDIMEHWGTNQNVVSSATHTPSSSGNTVNTDHQTIATASTDFHIYTLEWTADKLVFSVDGSSHFTYNPATKNASTWPFNAEQYLVLNVAMLPTVTAGFTQDTMEIDYIRIYQNTASNTITAAPIPQHHEVNDNVISIFSNTYSNVAGTNYDPSWGQITDATIEMIEGNETLKYDGLNYQGTEYTSQDVSALDYLHLDFWIESSSSLDFYLISQTPTVDTDLFSLSTSATKEWVSVNIPLTSFPNIDLTDVFQFKVVGNGTVYFDNLYFHSGSLLPVELSYFKGNAAEAYNKLNWQTLSEKSNSHFEIERSFDGKDFESIDVVQGNGTTVQTNNYNYLDRNFESNTYYRLKQIDFDGAFEYSNIIFINRNDKLDRNLKLYPNPTGDFLTIEFDATEETTVNLFVFDMTGKKVLSKGIISNEGNNKIHLDSSILPRGTYSLQLLSEKENSLYSFIKS